MSAAARACEVAAPAAVRPDGEDPPAGTTQRPAGAPPAVPPQDAGALLVCLGAALAWTLLRRRLFRRDPIEERARALRSPGASRERT